MVFGDLFQQILASITGLFGGILDPSTGLFGGVFESILAAISALFGGFLGTPGG